MKLLRKNIGSIVAATLILAACQKNSEYSVSGTVLDSKEVLVAELLPGSVKPIDTVKVENGEFELEKQFTKPTFLLLTFNSQLRLPIIVQPNEQIRLAVLDTGLFGTFSATGSTETEKLARQRDFLVQTLRVSDSLETLNMMYQDSANHLEQRKKWNVYFGQQLEAHRDSLKKQIDQDTTSLSNIMAFYQSIGQLELFNPDENFEYYKKVDNGLRANYPENEHVEFFHERLNRYAEAKEKHKQILEAAKNVVVGSQAPEIELPDAQGNIHKLSDLRGKVVLIDFWASWCGPCRRANPQLVSIYNEFSAKGFEVFSVSLDGLEQQANPKQEWQNAIVQDGLVWNNHVSDLLGYNSEVISKYGFQGIPFTVLVDADGKILALNVHGEELRNQLKKAL